MIVRIVTRTSPGVKNRQLNRLEEAKLLLLIQLPVIVTKRSQFTSAGGSKKWMTLTRRDTPNVTYFLAHEEARTGLPTKRERPPAALLIFPPPPLICQSYLIYLRQQLPFFVVVIGSPFYTPKRKEGNKRAFLFVHLGGEEKEGKTALLCDLRA